MIFSYISLIETNTSYVITGATPLLSLRGARILGDVAISVSYSPHVIARSARSTTKQSPYPNTPLLPNRHCEEGRFLSRRGNLWYLGTSKPRLLRLTKRASQRQNLGGPQIATPAYGGSQ